MSLDPLLAVVADGMGDGPGSAMAARTTVDISVEQLRATSRIGPASLLAAVAAASDAEIDVS
ncbi:hypothetical protein C1Y40_02588 [Mycobacterium talmoniae]|uniref:Uncharacterized protein n=1 Tax=Mycobacterium talmoniae TaxID=1858794 RepID=A0A2S8BKM4_9MYCO|nr:hypothetical protein [Mycobacterium eburneum]PQM47227.1 hypothetical protein C1Y40_02588 [Mycobacterium talmoniae]TDH47926.1 hypothetical protein E2F47_25965 [Mycobacterium eburneum]